MPWDGTPMQSRCYCCDKTAVTSRTYNGGATADAVQIPVCATHDGLLDLWKKWNDDPQRRRH